jgi:hypothetical protein
MHIFGAQIQAKPGRAAAAGTKVAEIRDVVSSATGQAGFAWAAVAGAPVGSFLLSTRLEGTAGLIELQMKLAESADYQKLAVDAGDLWAVPAETSFLQVVAAAGEPGEPQPVTTVTRSTISAGHLADALAWSNEVLEHVNKVTGLSGLLATSSAGSFFDVSWIFGAESGAAADEANNALMADPNYIGLIDKAGGLFVDGTAERITLVQLP